MKLTPSERKQIREELGKISKWPWRINPGHHIYLIKDTENLPVLRQTKNHSFIIQSPFRIAALLDELEEMYAAIRKRECEGRTPGCEHSVTYHLRQARRELYGEGEDG